MRIFFILSFFILKLFSDEVDLNKFEDRQAVIEDIRNLILYEEKLSIAYEKFLLDNYTKPTLAQLVASVDSFIPAKISLENLTLTNDKFNIRLNNNIKVSDLFAIYKSNKYRNHTYFYNNSIYFIMEDDFANHIYGLIKYNNNSGIQTCETTNGTITATNCQYNNHIFIDVTKIEDNKPSVYKMAYFIEKFKTGPIIFDSTNLAFTDSIFSIIPIGAVLYNFDGDKYIKTKDGIKVVN